MPLKDLLIALVVIVAWGVNFVVIKVGLDGLPPMLLGALRFLLVAVSYTHLTLPTTPYV